MQEPEKAKATEALSRSLSLPRGYVWQNMDKVSKALYGKPENGASLWKRLSGTYDQFKIGTERANIATRKMFGSATQEDIQRDEELKKQQEAPEATLASLPSGILQSLAGLGYMGVKGAETLSSTAAAIVSSANVGAWLEGKNPAKASWQAAKSSANAFLGTLVGGLYSTMRDRGVSPEVARGVGAGMLALNAVTMALPISKIPGVSRLLDGVVSEAASRAAVKGGLDAAIAVGGRLAGRTAEIGAYNTAYATANAIAPELAVVLNNRLKGTNLPTSTFKDIMSQIGLQATTSTLVMGALGAPDTIVEGGALSRELRAAAERAKAVDTAVKEETAATPQEPKVAAPTPESAKAIETAQSAQAEVAKMPIKDVLTDENGKEVPLELTQTEEKPVVPESPMYHGGPRGLSKLRIGGRGVEGSHGNPTAGWGIFLTPEETEASRYVKQFHGGEGEVYRVNAHLTKPYRMSFSEYDKFVKLDLSKDNLDEQMNRLTDEAMAFKQRLVNEGYDGIIIGERGKARASETVVFDPEKVEIFQKGGINRPIPEATGIPESSSGYELQETPLERQARIANEHVANLESKIDTLANASKDERTAYVDALKSAREEARLATKTVAAQTSEDRNRFFAIREAKKAERAHIRSLVSDIRGVEKSLPTMRTGEATVEAHRAAIEPLRKLFNEFTTKPARKVKLSGLSELASSMAAHPDTSFPQADLERLPALDKTIVQDLPPDDLQIVRDAIMHYVHVFKENEKIRVGSESIDRQVAIGNATEEIGRAKATRDMKVRASKTLGEKLQGTEQAIVGAAKRGIEQFDTLANMLGGGERSTLYQVLGKGLDEGMDVTKKWGQDIADLYKNWAKGHALNLDRWLDHKLEFPVPGTDLTLSINRGHRLALWGISQQKGGKESWMNGFVLPRSAKRYEAHQYAGELFDSIIASLDDTDKDFLQNAFGKMEATTWPELDKTYYRLNGIPPTKVEGFHYPLYRVKDYVNGNASPNDLMAQELGRNSFIASVSKAHLIPRVNSKAPIYWRDIREDMLDMASFSARYIGLAEPVRNAVKLAYSKEFDSALKARYNTDRYGRTVKLAISRIAGEKESLSGIERAADNLVGVGVNIVLGLRMTTAAINAMLGVRSLQYISPGDSFLGGIEAILHPLATGKKLRSVTTLYREMGEHGASLSQEAALGAPSRLVRKVSKVAMAPIMAGVKFSARWEMNGAMHQAMREFRAGRQTEYVQRVSGLSDEQVKALPADEQLQIAGKYAQYVTKRTHAVPREQFKAGLTREGWLGRYSMILTSEINSAWNMMARAAIDAPHVKGGWGQFAKAAIVLAIIEPLAVTAIRRNALQYSAGGKKHRESADEQFYMEMIDQWAGGLPFGRDISYGVKRAEEGHPIQGVVTGIAGENVDQTVALAGYSLRSMLAPTQYQRRKALSSLLQGTLRLVAGRKIGIPVSIGTDENVGVWGK